ncbi:hypothetical protein ERJ75_001183500 [Trypanosoma vivax]|nr:hypothetical protein ERJ75_001183500 [Trypanosoma vivax]
MRWSGGGEKAVVAFSGYARGFDSVDSGRIVKEQLSVGVKMRLVLWIAVLLWERTLEVRVNSALSEDNGLTCGDPRGSVVWKTTVHCQSVFNERRAKLHPCVEELVLC